MINKKQHILVKTWEQLEQKETGFVCYIKTLRIYDSHNHIKHQILTEQVWTVDKICASHMYHSSVRVFKDKVYYFKRINERMGSGRGN